MKELMNQLHAGVAQFTLIIFLVAQLVPRSSIAAQDTLRTEPAVEATGLEELKNRLLGEKDRKPLLGSSQNATGLEERLPSRRDILKLGAATALIGSLPGNLSHSDQVITSHNDQIITALVDAGVIQPWPKDFKWEEKPVPQQITEQTQLLKSKHPHVRWLATNALGKLGLAAQEAVPVLTEALQREEFPKIRQAMEQAISQIKSSQKTPKSGLEESTRRDFLGTVSAMGAAALFPGETTVNETAVSEKVKDFFGSPETHSLILPHSRWFIALNASSSSLLKLLETNPQEWVKYVTAPYVEENKKSIDQGTEKVLEEFFLLLKDQRVPSMDVLKKLYIILKSAQPPLGKSYGTSFRLVLAYDNSPHGPRGRLFRFIAEQLIKGSPEFQEWLKREDPELFRNLETIVFYFNGNLLDGTQVRAALRHFNEAYQRIDALSKRYQDLRRKAREKLVTQMGESFSKIDPNSLLKWFSERNVQIIEKLAPEDRSARSTFLAVLLSVFSKLPVERYQGLKVILTSESPGENEQEKSSNYVPKEDSLTFRPWVSLERIYPVSRPTHPWMEFEADLVHELVHRWDLHLLKDDQRDSFYKISWKNTPPRPQPGQTDGRALNLPRPDADHRDFLRLLRLLPGDLSASKAIEEPAQIGEALIIDYAASVRTAIEGLEKYGDPDLAQKIFHLYHFFGKVLDPQLYVVRADVHPLSQDNGTYLVRDGSKLEQITLLPTGITIEPLHGVVNPHQYLRKTGLEEGNWKVVGPIKGNELSSRMTEIAYSLAENGPVTSTVHFQTTRTSASRLVIVGIGDFGRWFSNLNPIELRKWPGESFPPKQWYNEYEDVLKNFGLSIGGNVPSDWFIAANSIQQGGRSYVYLTLLPFAPRQLAQQVPMPSDVETLEMYIRRIIPFYLAIARTEGADTLRISLVQGLNRETKSLDFAPSELIITSSERDISKFLMPLGENLNQRARGIIWPRGLLTKVNSVPVSHPEVPQGTTKQIREVTITLQTGLEEQIDIAPVPAVSGVQHFIGMFRDGDPNQLVDDPHVGVRLNLDLGNRETYVVDLPDRSNGEPAVLPSDIFILQQEGVEIPTAIRGITSVQFTDFEEVKAILEQRTREGKNGGIAFVALGNEDALDQLFRDYGVTGIRMTQNMVEILNELSLEDIFFAFIQNQKVGLILEAGLEEQNGQRRLFLNA